MATSDDPFRVVFVCTGNICRSPMADVVFRAQVAAAGYGDRVASRSAGTGDWHVGERADRRTLDSLARRGYDGSSHRARQFTTEDFERSDLIVALDRSHERILQNWASTPAEHDAVVLLTSFDPQAAGTPDVPDPYYAGPEMFDEVLTMIESATAALFRQVRPGLSSGR
ncbi:low molecular weight protein-tyrosine-phosphatase [Microbacterium gorillae]|uniref:low molecular weight protein-tyrosine-phosphatase n=1 Tax=Microbacterium gorillae TaxID=1231063 RepID=UPI00058D9687|nr:low molecular weight protein-tyrosine-phosphatase [Microbacterium gorillae]